MTSACAPAARGWVCRIAVLAVKEGDRVRKGQLLVQFDDQLPRAQVQQALARITQRMGDHRTLQELPPQVQAEVFNDQERINTVLVRAHEDSRQICQHTRTTGSNMPKSRCLTVAERRRIEEKGKALLNDQRTFNNFNPATNH